MTLLQIIISRNKIALPYDRRVIPTRFFFVYFLLLRIFNLLVRATRLASVSDVASFDASPRWIPLACL